LSGYDGMNPRPRLLNFADLPAKVATPTGKAFWQAVVACADGGLPAAPTTPAGQLAYDTAVANRMLSAAMIVRGGLPSGFGYKHTLSEYSAQAIADLLATKPTAPDGTNVQQEFLFAMPVALGYDWLYSDMTASERDKVRATILADISLRTGPHWGDPNCPSGTGMIGALAIAEDDNDPQLVAYRANWSAVPPPGTMVNYGYIRKYLPNGGSAEGAAYYARYAICLLHRACWKSATGSTELDDFRSINDAADWLYYGTDWSSWGSRLNSVRLRNTTYHAIPVHEGNRRQLLALTGSSNPRTAGLAAWILANSHFDSHAAAHAALYGLLIGDPRTLPVRPTEIDWITNGNAGNWLRRSADPQDTIVWFGCGNSQQRTTPMNEVYIADKGKTLLGYRGGMFNHHYCDKAHGSGDWFRNCVCFIGPDMKPISGQETTAQFDKGLGFEQWPGLQPQSDGSFIGRLGSELYYPKIPVTLNRRQVMYEKAGNVVTIRDAIDCDSAKCRPHICWNCVYEPVVSGRTVTVTNGDAVCTLTFDRDVQVIKVGGMAMNEYAGDLLGGVSGRVQDFTEWTRPALTDAERALIGGWWRFHVVPAESSPGRYDLTTTIQIGVAVPDPVPTPVPVPTPTPTPVPTPVPVPTPDPIPVPIPVPSPPSDHWSISVSGNGDAANAKTLASGLVSQLKLAGQSVDQSTFSVQENL